MTKQVIRAAELGEAISRKEELPAPIDSTSESVRSLSTSLASSLPRQVVSALGQLRAGLIPWLSIEDCHRPARSLPHTPQSMRPLAGEAWWPAAHAALALLTAAEMKAYAFASENEGHLFSNLSAVPSGHGLRSTKSVDVMKGHTDAVSFPFPDDPVDPRCSPAPDFVVLSGLRNPDAVATRVIPVARLFSKLSERQLDPSVFAEPLFVILQQFSFDLEHTRLDQPLLKFHPRRGPMFRFSNTRVSTEDATASRLKTAMTEVLKEGKVADRVVVKPGAVVLINNRTALHGRDQPSKEVGGESRWLLRTYGFREETQVQFADTARPWVLRP